MVGKKQTNINNDLAENPESTDFRKLILVFAILAVCFLLLAARLFQLQVIEKDEYRKLAKAQHEKVQKLKADRGNIYDRKGRLLATTIRSTSYGIDPSIVKDSVEINKIASIISKITGKDSTEITRKISGSKRSFLWLIRGLSSSESYPLDTFKLHGLIRIEEPKRVYLYGSVGSQVIGSTDIDNNGLTGIELSCDSLLKGSSGSILMIRDAGGNLIPTVSKPLINPVHGKSITLSIDIELQRIVENELELGAISSGAEAGSVIVQDPSTGEILAMASYPTFDPNLIEEIKPGAMRNRAVTDAYEPGSTFKVITAAAAIEENIISKNDIVDGRNGILQFPDYVIKDDHKIGKVTFKEAMELSSNIVFSDISSRIPTNYLYKYIRDFGFGLPYGLEIPGEASGRIKSTAQMDVVTKRFLGFGYSILVTPLQMINAFSVLANKGRMMQPLIILKIVNPDNSVYSSNSPQKIREIISESTARDLTEMMNGVVNNGTGKEAQIPGLKISGKTGTAQIYDSVYSKQHYTASFAGFLPSDNPKMTIMVVLDKPKTNIYGGSTAAPIFRNIAKSWISVSLDFLSDVEKYDKINKDFFETIMMPDMQGLDASQAIRILTNLGLNYPNSGKNYLISSQHPTAGTIISRDANITLNGFQPSFRGINVIGRSIKQAISELGHNGIEAIIIGSGLVREQYWENKKNGILRCRLICK
jgi:cell division protein FtsI/penicillin-binding protein 2